MMQLAKLVFNKKNLLIHFTLKRILLSTLYVFVAFILKFGGLSEFILGFVCHSTPSEWASWLLSAILSLPIKLSLKGVIEVLVDEIKNTFFPVHLFDSDDENKIVNEINPQTNEGVAASSTNPISAVNSNNSITASSNNQAESSSNPGNSGVTETPNNINRSFNIDLELTSVDVDGASNKMGNRLSKGVAFYNNRGNLFDTTNYSDTNLNDREKLVIINALNEKHLNVNSSNPQKVYCYASEVGNAVRGTSHQHNIRPGSLVELIGDPNSRPFFLCVNNSKPNLNQTLIALEDYRKKF